MSAPARSSRLSVGLAAILCIASLAAMEGVADRIAPVAVSIPPPVVSSSGLRNTYDEALAHLDDRLLDAKVRAEERPGEWLILEAVARLHLSRAKLTGSFQDYADAQRALQDAFRVAGPDVGPHLTQALLQFSVHRLSATSRTLDRIDTYAVPPPPEERAELIAMRGDLDFYSGNYDRALSRYRAADRLSEGAADFRLAIYHSKMGRYEIADRYLRRILKRNPAAAPQSRAFIELHRGILKLDQGKLDAALAQFHKAHAVFPGYWLVEEHIAEVAALKGDLPLAYKLYTGIVARTGHPEFMDALANIALQQGRPSLAREWRRRASGEWQRRLQLFPEATYGHALDHCLQKGDRACALDLARRNHSARPYGDAKLKLAEALMMNGRKDEAVKLEAEVQRSGWTS